MTAHERLMRASRKAFSAKDFDTAYQALEAALHGAEVSQDKKARPAEFEEIKRVATEQLAWIDAHAPEYKHSTRSTQARGLARGSVSMYELLVRQAKRNGG